MTGFRELFDRLLDADVRTRERILEDVHRNDPVAAKRLRAMIASSPDPASTLGLWKKLPENFGEVPKLTEGDRLDDFRVLAPLGIGGLATVYLAVDEKLGRRVALKVCRSTGKEPRLLAKLAHPGIVQAYRVFRDGARGVDVLVLQYIEGVTLEEALADGCFAGTDAGERLADRLHARFGSQPSDGVDREEAAARLRALDTTALALRLAGEVADALAFAHGRGVLHLDLKPSNVFLDRGGHAILGDFNVSVDAGDSRAVGGTPGYMAPEQLGTGPLDGRADLFSLGRVVGKLFAAATPPTGLVAWVERLTQPHPNDRPADVATAAASLREVARWNETERRHGEVASRVARWVRRRPLAATFLAAIVPNAVMSAVQILYNRIHIVDLATPAQQQIFRAIVGPWNVFVFALGAYLLLLRFRPIGTEPPERAIRRAVENVWIGGAIASAGWLAGCTLFVSALGIGAPPLAPELVWHFVVSFVLAAALCAAYAAMGIAYVAALGWIPSRYHPEVPAVVAATGREARRLGDWVRSLTMACTVLPLAAAAVIVWEGPGLSHGHGSYPFQVLVLLALVLSCVGFAVAGRLARTTLAALKPF